jgi:hypothetical protein
MPKPFKSAIIDGEHVIIDSDGTVIAVVPAYWAHYSEGVAEGIVRSLNAKKDIELPSIAEVLEQ